MEYWNDGIVGFLKDVIPILFFVKTNFAINLTFQYPKAHISLRGAGSAPEADIPAFQHSNLDEATNLRSHSVKPIIALKLHFAPNTLRQRLTYLIIM